MRAGTRLGKRHGVPWTRLKHPAKISFIVGQFCAEIRQEEVSMNFNPMDKLREAKEMALDVGAKHGAEVMKQANQLLTLLQDAGYQVGELNVDLGVPPTVTVELKAGPLVNYSKLDAIYLAHKDNEVLAMILGALIQANKLRDMVKLETIELKGARLVLKTPPSISLHWKEKMAASATGAAA
jgi:hypothetical protein